MKQDRLHVFFLLSLGLLLLIAFNTASASTCFEHKDIPVDSNAISFDKKLLILEQNGGYLWADIIYSQQQINAIRQNTIRDAWRAHNLSFTLKSYSKEDIHYLLPLLNGGMCNFTTGNYDKAFHHLRESKTVMDSMKQKGFSLGKEQVKIFKGEPYEQALTSIYMGLMLYTKSDYQNARAMFSQALELDRETIPNQDELNREDQKTQDMYSMTGNDNRFAYYMLARTYKHLEDEQDIDVSLKNCSNWIDVPEKIKVSSCGQFVNMVNQYDMPPPSENQYITKESIYNHNLVVIVQMGFAPKKSISGLEGQKDVIAPRIYPERKAVVYVDGKYMGDAYPMYNLLHQAASVPRTSKDTAQAGKAAGKFIVTLFAAVVSDSLANTINNAWSVAADTRRWGSAPNEIHVASGSIEPGLHNVTVLFYDQAGNPLPHYEQTHYFVPVKEDEETLLFVRSLKNKSNTLRDFYASKITSYNKKKSRMVFNPIDLLVEPGDHLLNVNEIKTLIESRFPQGKALDLFTVDFADKKMKETFVKQGFVQPYNPYYPRINPIQHTQWAKGMIIQKVGAVRITEIEGNKAFCEVIEGNPDPKGTYFVTTYQLPIDVIRQVSNHDVLDNKK